MSNHTEVWIVEWTNMNDSGSGIHGVFFTELAARQAADRFRCSPDSCNTIYRASKWIVGGPEPGAR